MQQNKNVKTKGKTKLNIKILIIILIIIIVIFAILLYHFTRVSKENILKLLNNGIENINFLQNYEDGTTVYYLNNVCKIKYANGDISYEDYNLGEGMYISNENETIEVYSVEESSNIHFSKYIGYFENEDRYTFKYEGQGKINNEKCWVISFLCSEVSSNDSQALYRIWVNKKLGTIEKLASYSYIQGSEELSNEVEYNMHENDVTEYDVFKPNLSDYSDYEYIE